MNHLLLSSPSPDNPPLHLPFLTAPSRGQRDFTTCRNSGEFSRVYSTSHHDPPSRWALPTLKKRVEGKGLTAHPYSQNKRSGYSGVWRCVSRDMLMKVRTNILHVFDVYRRLICLIIISNKKMTLASLPCTLFTDTWRIATSKSYKISKHRRSGCRWTWKQPTLALDQQLALLLVLKN